MRRRLDAELVRRCLAPSRAQAVALIEEGKVLVGGTVAHKPSRLVAPSDPVEVVEPRRYVSRGGHKLAAALERFSLDVTGLRCLDAGASTGGFTDCLLQHGAATVVAVDVGRGLLDARLRCDPRVVLLEGINVRDLTLDRVGGRPVDFVTADLSFISLERVAGALASVSAPGARGVFLVKPQFEAGRGRVGKGGVVRDPAVHRDVLGRVVATLGEAGLAAWGVMPSPLRGPAGNVEFLVAVSRGRRAGVPSPEIEAAVAEAHGEGRTR